MAPQQEKYPIDVFAIVVLISCFVIIAFLVVAAVYYINMINNKPPSTGEAMFLFWTSIIMIALFVGIAIYALVHLFTRKKKKEVVTQPTQYVAPKTTTVVATQPKPVVVSQVPAAPVVATPGAVTVSNVPPPTTPIVLTSRPTTESVSFSDVPITTAQEIALEQKLETLGSAISG